MSITRLTVSHLLTDCWNLFLAARLKDEMYWLYFLHTFYLFPISSDIGRLMMSWIHAKKERGAKPSLVPLVKAFALPGLSKRAMLKAPRVCKVYKCMYTIHPCEAFPLLCS